MSQVFLFENLAEVLKFIQIQSVGEIFVRYEFIANVNVGSCFGC